MVGVVGKDENTCERFLIMKSKKRVKKASIWNACYANHAYRGEFCLLLVEISVHLVY
jgi:hypothetical protein